MRRNAPITPSAATGSTEANTQPPAARALSSVRPPEKPTRLATAPAAAAPTGMTDDKIATLQKLADLHKSGVLTDEEFAAQKAKILAG